MVYLSTDAVFVLGNCHSLHVTIRFSKTYLLLFTNDEFKKFN